MTARSPVPATLDTLATTDSLTGLAGRGVLEARLEEEVRRARRYGRVLSVLMCDVDGLKQINDTHGNSAGDAVLCAVADLLEAVIRPSDLVGRWDGDDFLAICPEVSAEGAWHLARKLVRGARQPLHVRGRLVQPAISVGWSTAGSDVSGVSLLSAARTDLDDAKARAAGAFWHTG